MLLWRRTVIHRLFSSKQQHPWLPSLFHYSSDAAAANKKGKAAPLQERRMRDRVRLWAKGGEGGNGCWSYRRTRTDRFGKPDGGNGGRGGDVILECSPAVWDFSNLQHHLNAKGGGNGVSKNKIGSRGPDKVVQVPTGTVIHLVSGKTPEFVVDTSIKSLHPWEIPEVNQADLSKSLKHDSSDVSSFSSLHKEDIDDSASPQHTCYVEKSTRLLHKVSDPHSTQEKGKSKLKGLLSHHESNNRRIKVQERDEYEYELEFAAENEQDEENEEGFEDEYEEEEVQFAVAELTKPGQRLVVARGGEGGLGNACFGKRSRALKCLSSNKHHDVSSGTENEDSEDNSSLSSGIPGSESVLILELKSIADVGLVGMPNAGKSTLLGAISRAKPTVGHYAFTTLRPNIGNLNYDDFFSVTVADIPGLIKGAHENRGLGHAFLRHIERTKVLAYVVDLAAASNGRKGIAPWEQLRDLVSELEHHQEGLSHRPSLVVANKIDEEGAEDVYEELKRRVQGVPIFPVCAVLEEGVPELKAGLRKLMDGSESQCLQSDRIMVD